MGVPRAESSMAINLSCKRVNKPILLKDLLRNFVRKSFFCLTMSRYNSRAARVELSRCGSLLSSIHKAVPTPAEQAKGIRSYVKYLRHMSMDDGVNQYVCHDFNNQPLCKSSRSIALVLLDTMMDKHSN